MSKTDRPDKDRRAALLRLGLGALAVYTAPALTTLSRAHASSGGGSGGGGSGGGSGGGGSGGGNGGGGSGGGNGGRGGGSGGGSGGASGSSGGAASRASAASSGSAGASLGSSVASASSGPSDGSAATISARDHRRAQKAVRDGRAKPLIEVLNKVHSSLGGKLISVRYRESGNTNSYIFKVVTDDGRLKEVNVDARTARIMGASG